ncbi:MAG: RHS repeat-associated core domain-containing protein, partial [Acidobacteriota bacterium]
MARSARLSNPTGLARDAEGNLYIADRGHDRIRRVTPAGVITTVAGNGGTTFDPASEGQQATAVAVPDGKSVTVRRDGTIVIASLDRLLAVDPDGRLRTLLGGGTANPIVAGVPSLNGDFGNLWSPNEMPDGTLAVGDGFLSVVFQIGEPLPGYSGDEIRIPNPSGTEVWVFDRQGRHLKTVDSLTQADLWAFAYDAEGRLLTLTDGDNLTTAIERIAGVPKALIGPYGHRTELGLDPNGWLNDVTTPAGRQQTFRYTEDGLMDRHTDARGATSEYLFSETGHLIAATNRAGTTQTFTRFGFGEDYRVLQTSPSGLATRYHVNRQGSGATENTRTRSDGFATTTSRSADGTRQQVAPDGTVTTTRLAADPRFGMTSAIAAEVVTTTPGGKTRVTQHDRAVTLGDPLDPLSVTSMIDTVTVNGKTSTRAWDAATRTYTLTSPEGRIVTVKVDEQRRPLETKLPGFLAVEMSYDTDGLVRSIAQGSGTDRREMAFDYDLLGRLETHTDPEARTTTYTHDPDDLPSSQVLPGNRTLGLGFDGNGNLNRVTPPGRPDHTFEYTPDDLPELYRPPTLGGNFESSSSTFDNDRRPELITRAGRQEVDLGYDPEGRLESIAVDGDALTYGYSDTTGQLESLTGPAAAPDRQALTYGFDGFLPTSTTWSGPVAGSVARSFDDDFRLTTESVNGLHTVTFVYDDDGLLEGAGDLDLIRSASSGFLTGTALQSVTTATGYSPFGEISSLSATAVSTEIFRIDVPVRDSLGRIVETRETIQGVTDTVIYDYDPAGRLETVTKNGTLVATYGYDANGNRTSFSSPNETITAVVHDDQDRLTTYGDLTFTYKKSGELATKTQNGQTVQYGYDAFGNLRTVDLPDGISIEYLVDGEGRRIGKKVQGVLGQGFLYGDRLNPIAELDSSGAVLSRFVYGSKGWVPDYLVKGGVTYRILSDLRGSVRLVVDAATGAIVQRLDFDEYGRVLQDTNPGFQPFGYAGGLWDPQTGLVRFGARDYDPEIGRWTAKDPIGFAGGDTNLYAYVANDPINLIDPSGEIAPLAVLYLLAEIGFTIYDIYDLLNTLQDPTVSDCEKLLTAIGATLGIAAVGGGYGWLARKLYRWYKARKAADLLKDVAKRQSRKAPNQVPPGVRTLEGQYIDDLGRVQPWKAHYDEYGRQVGRTDFNAGNRSQGIPDTHYHRTEYSAQFPHGKSAGDHVPGEFPGVRP